jgi:hypothetical protein
MILHQAAAAVAGDYKKRRKKRITTKKKKLLSLLKENLLNITFTFMLCAQNVLFYPLLQSLPLF